MLPDMNNHIDFNRENWNRDTLSKYITHVAFDIESVVYNHLSLTKLTYKKIQKG